jgi:hypothetical protein
MAMRMWAGKFTELLTTDLLAKTLRALDRTAMVMIIVSWSAAILMMGVALYTVSSAHHARQEADEAAAIEPLVPVIKRAALARKEMDGFVDRLRSRYKTVSINASPDNALEISGTDPNNFLDWLSALSYLDTIAPQMRWTIRDLCVGNECGGSALMRAAIIAERVTFQAPQPHGEEIKEPGKS